MSAYTHQGMMVRRKQSSRNSCPSNGELENPQLKKDFDAIIAAIKKIIDDCGARENLFRPEGNNIKAIPLCIEQRRGKGVGTRKIHADYDDYQKVKMIIEAITI